MLPIRRLAVAAAAVQLLLSAVPADAQIESAPAVSQRPVEAPAKRGKEWRVAAPAFRLVSEYDDNVFLLSDDSKSNLSDAEGEDPIGGKYAGMQSASDLITTFDAELTVKGPGAFGRTLAFTPELRYAFYAQNAERRHATFGLTVEQSLPRGREVRLRLRATPSYFSKNYLADAVDQDGSGTIEADEGDYRPGRYQETELSMHYQHRLTRSGKAAAVGTAIRVGGGLYTRSYDAPFAGRNVTGPTARLALLTDLWDRVELDLDYEFAALSADPTNEVLLIDEARVGQDLNGNGTTTDIDVRSVQTVDRSRTEHRLGATVDLAFNAITDLRLSIERRQRDYGSTQPMDVAYNGRRTARTLFESEVSFRLTPAARFVVGGAAASQSINRADDVGGTGEEADYVRRSGTVGLRFRF